VLPEAGIVWCISLIEAAVWVWVCQESLARGTDSSCAELQRSKMHPHIAGHVCTSAFVTD
jgi:hypothetical protein